MQMKVKNASGHYSGKGNAGKKYRELVHARFGLFSSLVLSSLLLSSPYFLFIIVIRTRISFPHRISIDIRCFLSRHAIFLLIKIHELPSYVPLLSKTLIFALWDLEFSFCSLSDGRTGFFVITFPRDFFPQTQTGKSGGQVHGFSFLR